MQISLKNNKGFKWYKSKTVFIKGYFYDNKNVFYKEEAAVNYLSSIKSKEEFIKIISQLNGVYTILIHLNNRIFVACDLTRSFPLFYTFHNNEFVISDDIIYLKSIYNINDFNALSEIELKASNHTHGKKTLLKNVFQLQSSEYLIIKENKIIESKFFFSYATKKIKTNSYNSLKKEMFISLENTFNRFIKSLNNKPIIIPLSGGFDSRLIAVFLKKHNYKNVTCYTYGNKNSNEIENSKKTAKVLGFKWHFIEYNNLLIDGFLETQEFKEYAHFAGKLSSMPYLQEYFAVKYLSENKLISNDSIFIPGYAGDLLGGSQFLKVIPKNLKTEEIVNLIICSKFSIYKISSSDINLLIDEVAKNLKNIDPNYKKKIPSSVFENYDIKEKIAKYIFNSANFYTFFGYEHRFPFWDKELLEFFSEIPIKHKLNKMLFDDVLINNFFKPNNVYFEKELQPTKKTHQLQKIKNIIKSFLPTFIKQKILQKNDSINYKPITEKMLLEMKKNDLKVDRNYNSYNEIITQWYLYFSKNMIK